MSVFLSLLRRRFFFFGGGGGRRCLTSKKNGCEGDHVFLDKAFLNTPSFPQSACWGSRIQLQWTALVGETLKQIGRNEVLLLSAHFANNYANTVAKSCSQVRATRAALLFHPIPPIKFSSVLLPPSMLRRQSRTPPLERDNIGNCHLRWLEKILLMSFTSAGFQS